MIEFKSFHAVTLRIGQSIEIDGWKFTEPNEGVGQLEADMRPHPRYRDAFVPDQHGVAMIDDGQVQWAGILRERPWRHRAKEIKTISEDLGSFFYDRVRSPDLGDYLKVDTEQLTLWNDLIDDALTGAPATGVPAFQRALPSIPTGVLRQLTLRSLKNYGAAFDNLANRDNGLDWWMTASLSENGQYIVPMINVGARGKLTGSPIRAESIRASQSRKGGNVIDFVIPDSSSIRRTAVYATGDGQPPDVPWSYDEDPLLDDGLTLRREIVVARAGVVLRPTLTLHAEDERRYRGIRTHEINVWLPPDAPNYRTYSTGDRVRLEIVDVWTNLFLPATKIVEREVSGNRGEVRQVQLTLDASDYDLPAEDSGVEVT